MVLGQMEQMSNVGNGVRPQTVGRDSSLDGIYRFMRTSYPKIARASDRRLDVIGRGTTSVSKNTRQLERGSRLLQQDNDRVVRENRVLDNRNNRILSNGISDLNGSTNNVVRELTDIRSAAQSTADSAARSASQASNADTTTTTNTNTNTNTTNRSGSNGQSSTSSGGAGSSSNSSSSTSSGNTTGGVPPVIIPPPAKSGIGTAIAGIVGLAIGKGEAGANAIGGQVNQVEQNTSGILARMSTEMTKSRGEAIQTYSSMVGDLQKFNTEISGNIWQAKFGIDDFNAALNDTLDMGLNVPGTLRKVAMALVPLKKILPDVDFSKLEFSKTLLQNGNINTVNMIAASIKKISVATHVSASTLASSLEGYHSYLTTISGDLKTYEKNMNAVLAANGALENMGIDSTKLSAEIQQLGQTSIMDMGDKVVKYSMVGLDPMAFRSRAQTNPGAAELELAAAFKKTFGGMDMDQLTLQSSITGWSMDEITNVLNGNKFKDKSAGPTTLAENTALTKENLVTSYTEANKVIADQINTLYVSAIDQFKNAVQIMALSNPNIANIWAWISDNFDMKLSDLYFGMMVFKGIGGPIMGLFSKIIGNKAIAPAEGAVGKAATGLRGLWAKIFTKGATAPLSEAEAAARAAAAAERAAASAGTGVEATAGATNAARAAYTEGNVVRGLFGAEEATTDVARGGGILSKIIPGLAKVGGVMSKIAAPLAVLGVGLGGFLGVTKSQEFLGKEQGNTVGGKIASGIGGALGGDKGISRSNIGGGLVNMGLGAAQGAGIGAGIGLLGGPFAPITSTVGVVVGGIVGLILAAFGGDRIAAALKTAGDAIGYFFSKIVPDFFVGLWGNISGFFTNTVPTFFSGLWGNISGFFTNTVPNFFSGLWGNISGFFTNTVPDFFSGLWGNISGFFTNTVPDFFSGLWENISGFFTKIPSFIFDTLTKTVPHLLGNLVGMAFKLVTKTIPNLLISAGTAIWGFLSNTLPTFFMSIGTAIWGFLSNTLPTFFMSIGTAIWGFITKTIPSFFIGIGTAIWGFISTTVPNFFIGIGTAIWGFITTTIPNFFISIGTAIWGFITTTIPNFFIGIGTAIWGFLSTTVPNFFIGLGTTIWNFLSTTIPNFFIGIGTAIWGFITTTIPNFFIGLGTTIWNFLTVDLPKTIQSIGATIWGGFTSFFTDIVPNFFMGLLGGIGDFFTKTIPSLFSSLWDWVKGGFKGVINWGADVLKTVVNSGTSGFNETSGLPTTVAPKATGMDYVPYDGFMASLHKGEAVLTRTEADKMRAGITNTYSNFTFFDMLSDLDNILLEFTDFSKFMKEKIDEGLILLDKLVSSVVQGFNDVIDSIDSIKSGAATDIKKQTFISPRGNSVIPKESASSASSASSSGAGGRLDFIKDYRISSPFGMRNDPINGTWKNHTGVDLPMPLGTPLKAASDGKISFAGPNGAYGNAMKVLTSDGYTLLYGHLSQTGLAVGTPVNKGDIIGYSGSTGRSTGPHLHFQVENKGVPTDPVSWVHGYAIGLNYVPRNEFPAMLHKGESVLTRTEGEQYRGGGVAALSAKGDSSESVSQLSDNVVGALDRLANLMCTRLDMVIKNTNKENKNPVNESVKNRVSNSVLSYT